MCGIAGFTRFNKPTGDETTLLRMGDVIAHRGPDAHGEYLDENVGLCHRRLSIIDLSEAGNQPMYSNDNNLVMIFNGEVYNYLDLRSDLEQRGYRFQSRSDSEVLLALYQFEGESCLQKLNGMFAIAIWDRKKQELFLARDRLGKKPLYYYSGRGQFVFASEIKAILKVDSVPREVRDDAVYDYFVYQYVPDPKSIFRDIHKLEPGHWMKIGREKLTIRKYWDISFKPLAARNDEEIVEGLRELISDSVRMRMTSDVPLGAFLSGGVDSSGVVALMARNSEIPPVTCTIGFGSRKYDEVSYARTVSDLYGTIHHELTVKKNIIDNLQSISRYFDEPFADQSLVPTYFVSQIARQKVTVALAGDGGDENFAGYEKYRTDQIEHRIRSNTPEFLRNTLAASLTSPLRQSSSRLLRRMGTLLGAISSSPAKGFYQSNAFMTDLQWNRLARNVFKKKLDGYHPSRITLDHYHTADVEDHLSRILYSDIKTFLVGDILVKVDRMSMANSLEVRAPLLDYRVVEYAASIPSHLKLHRGEKKVVLKKCFEGLLPDDILYRKKMGFSVPLAGWLKNELKLIGESALFDPSSGISNFFSVTEVRRLWSEHQHGSRDHSTALWSLLMFELWWQNYMT